MLRKPLPIHKLSLYIIALLALGLLPIEHTYAAAPTYSVSVTGGSFSPSTIYAGSSATATVSGNLDVQNPQSEYQESGDQWSWSATVSGYASSSTSGYQPVPSGVISPSVSASSGNASSTVTANADNTTSPGYYQITVTGTDNFTVTDSTVNPPTVTPQTQSGSTTLTIIVMTLTISGSTSPIVVGQQVTLNAEEEPSDLNNSPIVYTWAIGGNAVYSYTQTNISGSYIQLGKASVPNPLQFYWIVPGECTVSVEDPRFSGSWAKATFDVIAPKLTSYKSFTSVDGVVIGTSDGTFPAVSGDPSYPSGFMPAGTLYDQFGIAKPIDAAGQHIGIVIGGDATLPSGVAGQFGILQLTSVDDYSIEKGIESSVDSKGYVLDDGASGNFSIINNANGGAAGLTVLEVDNPGVSSGPNTVSALSENEQFEDYFMFEPSGQNSIWVTIGTLAWNWQGAGNLQNGNFVPSGVKWSENPTGSPSTSLPTWGNDIAHVIPVTP